ncbi:MAG: class I SAM-dependent methyltransferase [Candidatus Methanofastidiosia archaeon]
MIGVKVRKKLGEKTRKRLVEENLLEKGFRIISEKDYLIFPVKGKVGWIETVETEFERLKKEKSFQEYLEKILPGPLVNKVRTFDAIGDIAVFEIQEELVPYAQEMGEAFLKTHKHFKTVLSKSSSVEGEFRTRAYKLLAGEDKTETIHTEYGLKFVLDVKKVFFSPRLSTERKRISDLVSEGEIIIDMFCGIGPFSIFISRFSNAQKIYAIDINPDAIKYLQINIERNKAKNIVPILGDAKKEVIKLPKADRITMNLPKLSKKFLPSAIETLKKGGMIHYYTIVTNEEENEQIEFIKKKAFLKDRKAIIFSTTNVKTYSPHKYLKVFDIRIT